MKNLIDFIPRFKDRKILVLGDMMVDKFVWGKVSRISPEAPVPVVLIEKETYAFGGAGNVANNLTSLGAQVYIAGVIGNDVDGGRMKEEMSIKNMNVDGVIVDDTRPTSIKTRIIASHQQVVRVDKELKSELTDSMTDRLMNFLEKVVPKMDAMIISDYGKGVINKSVLKQAISLAIKNRIHVNVDPKIEHFLSYKKVSCITPNQLEAVQGMRWHDVSDDKGVIELGKKILKKLNSKTVLITRGEKGMTLFEDNSRITHIPTRAKEVYDVTGAGDTVIATFTLALSCGANYREAAEISNFAAGIVVGKIGTATTNPKELTEAIGNFKK
jgi:D-beta-D-heptose 7-phosphate kinase/D-beta-D-heptose 1-phosphate adenosyltransferase